VVANLITAPESAAAAGLTEFTTYRHHGD